MGRGGKSGRTLRKTAPINVNTYHARVRMPLTVRRTFSSESLNGRAHFSKFLRVCVAGGIRNTCKQWKHHAIQRNASMIVSTSAISAIPSIIAASSALRIP